MVSKAWVCDVLCFYNTCSVITQTRRGKSWNGFVNKRIYGNSGYGDHIPWARSVVEMAVLLDTAWPHHHRLHNVSLKILTWLESRLQVSAGGKKKTGAPSVRHVLVSVAVVVGTGSVRGKATEPLCSAPSPLPATPAAISRENYAFPNDFTLFQC